MGMFTPDLYYQCKTKILQLYMLQKICHVLKLTFNFISKLVKILEINCFNTRQILNCQKRARQECIMAQNQNHVYEPSFMKKMVS